MSTCGGDGPAGGGVLRGLHYYDFSLVAPADLAGLRIPEGPAGTLFGDDDFFWVSRHDGGAAAADDGAVQGYGTVSEAVFAYLELASGVTTQLWAEDVAWSNFTAIERVWALGRFSAVHVVTWPAGVLY